MKLGFGGEVVEYYHQYRHGYPEAVIDVLADLFGLSGSDVVVDLGCGTGQLTLAVAGPGRCCARRRSPAGHVAPRPSGGR